MTRAPARWNGALVSGAIFVIVAPVYLALGNAVSHRPPAGIDLAARGLVGEAPGVAWIFTASCLWPVLTLMGLAGCIVAIRAPAWRARITFSILTTIVAWQTSNMLKDYFARPRPDYWILRHESTFAYSSGHAMFAVIIYWLWAYHAARSAAPPAVRAVLCGIFATWGGAVIWSRLALGAHYPSDLVGGVLLAIAMLALSTAVACVIAPSARLF